MEYCTLELYDTCEALPVVMSSFELVASIIVGLAIGVLYGFIGQHYLSTDIAMRLTLTIAFLCVQVFDREKFSPHTELTILINLCLFSMCAVLDKMLRQYPIHRLIGLLFFTCTVVVFVLSMNFVYYQAAFNSKEKASYSFDNYTYNFIVTVASKSYSYVIAASIMKTLKYLRNKGVFMASMTLKKLRGRQFHNYLAELTKTTCIYTAALFIEGVTLWSSSRSWTEVMVAFFVPLYVQMNYQ
mmetsp:Transcript_32378/g.56040  ORF Transcript_32378/g.56040 Transcript_32378/m.56040 type:complete len:242 (-) Transcript_32378:49-774(-)